MRFSIYLATFAVSLVPQLSSAERAARPTMGQIPAQQTKLQGPKPKITSKTFDWSKGREFHGMSDKEIEELKEQVRREILKENKNGEIRIAGNGGDTDLLAVQKYRSTISAVLDLHMGSMRIPISRQQLDINLKAEILFSEKILLLDGTRKGGINIPELNMIVIDREMFRDMNENEQLFFIFHETLGLSNLDLDYSITAGIPKEVLRLMNNTLISTSMANSFIQQTAYEENSRRRCIESRLKEALKNSGIATEGIREAMNLTLRTNFQLDENLVSSGFYILRYKNFLPMDVRMTSEAANTICRGLNRDQSCAAVLTPVLTKTLLKNGACQ